MDSNSDSNCRDSSVERLPLVSIIILTRKYVTVIRLASTVSTESIIILASKYVTVIRLASTVSTESIIIHTSKYVTVIHLCKEISIRLTHVFEVWYSLKNVFKKILICGNSVLYSHTKAFFYWVTVWCLGIRSFSWSFICIFLVSCFYSKNWIFKCWLFCQ